MTAPRRTYFPETSSDARSAPARTLLRQCAVLVRAAATGGTHAEAAVALFGRETGNVILRASVVPASTTGWGGTEFGGMALLISALAPASAAAQLIQRGIVVDMTGIANFALPSRLTTTTDAGRWIPEAAGIPVIGLTGIGDTTPILHVYKIAVGVAYTREVAVSSAIEQFIRGSLGLAIGLALDKKIFSSDAAVANTSPAGILTTTPLSATTGGGVAALAGDIEKLLGALVTAGVGIDPVLIVAPAQAASIKCLAGAKFDFPVFSSAALAAGTVAMVEASSFVSGFRDAPEIEATTEGTYTADDSSPTKEIVDSAGTVAPSVRSLWQSDCVALKARLPMAYALLVSTHAQSITSCTW